MRILTGVFIACVAATARAEAEAPRVSVDIAPIYSLVSQVMEGVGTPDLIVPLNASPHGYSMRPSEARALSEADIVFWVGDALTPWLHKPLDTLAEKAEHVSLLEARDTNSLEFRQGASFDAHDHDHEHAEEHDKEHAHDHKNHAHDDHAKEEEHAHGDEDHDHSKDEDHAEDVVHHHEDGLDPHAWLDPKNAAVWLDVIAEKLSEKDPANAATYRENASAAAVELENVEALINETLADVKEEPFVVLHDAFQYFENRFGVTAVASISLGDATAPSAARLAEVRTRIQETGANCILMEPEQAADLGRTVAEDAGMRMAVVSPLSPLQGDIGPDSYSVLLLSMAKALKECLSPVS